METEKRKPKRGVRVLWSSGLWIIAKYTWGYIVGPLKSGTAPAPGGLIHEKEIRKATYFGKVEHAIEDAINRAAEDRLAKAKHHDLEELLEGFREARQEAQAVIGAQIAERLDRIEKRLAG